MIDGRLIEQINNMQNNFSKACIVVHGNPFKHVSDMEYSNVLGMMASICARTNVNFIMLPDWQYVVEFCYKFLTKATDGKPFVAAGVKKSELDINTQILTLIQGISITKATALLSSLNGLKSVLQASQTDLTKVKGIGNGLATNIRQFGGLFYDI
jgi:ERCC4-type nuclease